MGSLTYSLLHGVLLLDWVSELMVRLNIVKVFSSYNKVWLLFKQILFNLIIIHPTTVTAIKKIESVLKTVHG